MKPRLAFATISIYTVLYNADLYKRKSDYIEPGPLLLETDWWYRAHLRRYEIESW